MEVEVLGGFSIRERPERSPDRDKVRGEGHSKSSRAANVIQSVRTDNDGVQRRHGKIIIKLIEDVHDER